MAIARLAAAGVVANEASSRTALEAFVKSAEDRTTTAQAATANTVTEWESLAAKLTQAEAAELQSTMTTVNNAAEKATNATATNEAATTPPPMLSPERRRRLKSKVAELEQDLSTAGADLRTANRKFSELSNKLQDVTNEVTWLWDANSQLTQDVDIE